MSARSRIADLAVTASGRLAGAPPCDDIPAGRARRTARAWLHLPGGHRSTAAADARCADSSHRAVAARARLHRDCSPGTRPSPRCAARYRVVTFDQRWHGQGIRSPAFSLADCADDVAAVADVLGLDRFDARRLLDGVAGRPADAGASIRTGCCGARAVREHRPASSQSGAIRAALRAVAPAHARGPRRERRGRTVQAPRLDAGSTRRRTGGPWRSSARPPPGRDRRRGRGDQPVRLARRGSARSTCRPAVVVTATRPADPRRAPARARPR